MQSKETGEDRSIERGTSGAPLLGKTEAASLALLLSDVMAEPPVDGPKDWAQLGRKQQQEREQERAAAKAGPPPKPQAPEWIVLKHGDKEMRRWQLPKKGGKNMDALAAAALAARNRQNPDDMPGSGSYFSADNPAKLGTVGLRCAPADMLLAPSVRAARDAAYAAAIAAGHSREVAAAAAAVAVKAIILKKPLNVALIMAAQTAQSLADGYDPRVATAAGVRAGELFQTGFSAGAALAGGRAYAEAMHVGHSPSACDAASLAAAVAADAAGEDDPEVATALSRGEIPPHILPRTVAAGAAAADAIKSGASPYAASIAGKAAAKAIADGYDDEAAAAAGAAAATSIMAGHAEDAAMAAGEAAARTIAGGGSWEDAMLAGAVAADACAQGMSLSEALNKAARVAAGVEKFQLHIVDANDTEIEAIDLGIDESDAITGGDTMGVEAEVEAYLDLKFHDEGVSSIYKDRKKMSAPPAPAAPAPADDAEGGGGGGAAAAGVGSAGGGASGRARGGGGMVVADAQMVGGRIRLEGAMETALTHVVEYEDEMKAKKRGQRGGQEQTSEGSGCALM